MKAVLQKVWLIRTIGLLLCIALFYPLLFDPIVTTFNVTANTERIAIETLDDNGSQLHFYEVDIYDKKLKLIFEKFNGSLRLNKQTSVVVERTAYGPAVLTFNASKGQVVGTLFNKNESFVRYTDDYLRIFINDIKAKADSGQTTILTIDGKVNLGRSPGFETYGDSRALLREGQISMIGSSTFSENFDAGSTQLYLGNQIIFDSLNKAFGFITLNEKSGMQAAYRVVADKATISNGSPKMQGSRFTIQATKLDRLLKAPFFQHVSLFFGVVIILINILTFLIDTLQTKNFYFFKIKTSSIILLSLFGILSHDLSGQQPVYVKAREEGTGILKTRLGECFVITPAHVAGKKGNGSLQIIGARNVLSKGEVLEIYPPDLAIIRIVERSNQNCEDWTVDSNYDKILTESMEGSLEFIQNNGAVKSMKVFISKKDDIQITVRPYLPNDQIKKGMSGSSLFRLVDGSKTTYLGMLVAIENATDGIVLQATVIDKVLSSFFTISTTRLTEIAVVALKAGTMDAFELAQKASDILTKQYPDYAFVPYEKGKLPRSKAICEIFEFTENDPENKVDGQIHKFKTRLVLTVRNDGQLISRETLIGGGTDYSKENAQVLSVTRTLELTEKLKFEKR